MLHRLPGRDDLFDLSVSFEREPRYPPITCESRLRVVISFVDTGHKEFKKL